jgi:hypothetical protein
MTILEAVTPVWLEYEWIGLRIQSGAECRTKIGQTLRPSSEWVDGTKTRRKLSGTAAFCFRDIDDIPKVLATMQQWGYVLRNGDRLVVVGSNDGCNGDDMPERYASAITNAVLLAVIG